MAGVIISPGSHVRAGAGQSWTNTVERASAEARKWLAEMHSQGMTDVELVGDAVPATSGGRWVFTFRHRVTGTQAQLETHGIDDMDAYCQQHIFAPHIYWKGSSVGEPSLDDFAAAGFEPVWTFRRTMDAPGVADG